MLWRVKKGEISERAVESVEVPVTRIGFTALPMAKFSSCLIKNIQFAHLDAAIQLYFFDKCPSIFSTY